MANVNAVAGLSPVQYKNGAPWTGGGRVYYIASSDTHAYAIGDPVTLSGNGDSNGVPAVTLATAGATNVVLGSVLGSGGVTMGGAYTDPANINSTIIPATKTKGYYILVADDPNILFEVQEGGAGAALTSASIGLNVNLLAGANSGFLSGWTFDNTTAAVGATLQMQLLGLVLKPNNAFGQYAKWLVRINNHQYAAGVAGV